ncbi:hypothetical protein PoB_002009600 [Plakobranchus ocellatus]|uniref:H-type lectin domain-containing protein n=1 Tax=Plakobranchus ocellatus TaxID=259542 RepID=A0AAV3Z2P9_9GAST|nr:hypothetical protein PoB_002009600 [Plakobranchus ocellatus]
MSLKSVLSACLCIVLVNTAWAQINPLFLLNGDLGEGLFDFFGNGAGKLLLLRNLGSRLTALEANIRTGALGGCESGVIGPFSSTQTTATITFRGTFLTPPSISLSLSDLTTTNAGTAVSVTIRPSSVSTTSAGVVFSAAPTNNVASAFVSYMACPSNSSPAVSATASTTSLLG